MLPSKQPAPSTLCRPHSSDPLAQYIQQGVRPALSITPNAPNSFPTPNALTTTQEINAAWNTLSDETRRLAWDLEQRQTHESTWPPSASQNTLPALSSFFEPGFFAETTGQPVDLGGSPSVFPLMAQRAQTDEQDALLPANEEDEKDQIFCAF